MDKQKVIISANLENALAEAVSECSPDRLFVLMDETTERLCLPVVSQFKCMENARPIVIKAGDQHKELDAVVHVWNELQHLGATRNAAYSSSIFPQPCSQWSMHLWAARRASTSVD